jgi:hypothetical protein
MNVEQLMRILKRVKHPRKTRVVVDGYEGGLSDPQRPFETMITLGTNNGVEYLGPHELSQEDETGVPAIYIPRS